MILPWAVVLCPTFILVAIDSEPFCASAGRQVSTPTVLFLLIRDSLKKWLCIWWSKILGPVHALKVKKSDLYVYKTFVSL